MGETMSKVFALSRTLVLLVGLAVIASPTGLITKLDTEDRDAGYGLIEPVVVTGSLCSERLGIKSQG